MQGFGIEEAEIALRWAGYTVTPPEESPRMVRLRHMVEDGVSIQEICRTLKMDYRTIKRRYPDYHGIGKPGSPEVQAVIKAKRRFKELEG